MERIPLKKEHVLTLKNQNNQIFRYTIKGIINNTVEGSSCLSYIASKDIPSNGRKLVVLKEFYPDNETLKDSRSEDGSLTIYAEGNEHIVRILDNFKRGVKYLNRFANNPNTEEFICADPDVELLSGNGTFYCENQFCNGSISWKESRDNKDYKMDEIIQTALGTLSFLRCLHAERTAYVDLKPEDILIPVSANGELEFQSPLFYDFNSALEIDKRYYPWEINCTEEYKAAGFAFNPGMSLEIPVEVNTGTESCTYGKVLEYQIKEKLQTITENVRDKLIELVERLKGKSREVITEAEAEKRLMEIRDQIRDDECEKEYQKLPDRKRKFEFHRGILLFITICAYVLMGLLMGYMCMHSADIKSVAGNGRMISTIVMTVLLLFSALLIFALKISNSLLAERLANTMVSVKYYHTDIHTGEYNTFRYGTRKRTTFQDTSENNQSRQNRRRILWVALALAIVCGFGFSLYCQSFPVFLIIAFSALIVFIFADCIPANREFFINYAKKRMIQPYDHITGAIGRALFYSNEYLNAGHSFDLDNDYYVRHKRNLFCIRKTIKETCFKDEKNSDLMGKLRWLYSYQYRMKLIKYLKKHRDESGIYTFTYTTHL